MTLQQRYILLPMLLVMAAASGAQAQDALPVYRATWTIQDRAYGLRQEIARSIIAQANDWLTRDNPAAPTARLDDRVHVTVVGEMLPPTGMIRTRLARLQLGTIPIDGSFDEFLDTATISSIIRRDHFWRDESIVTFNQRLAPNYAAAAAGSDNEAGTPIATRTTPPRAVVAIDRSLIRFDNGTTLWVGIGYEELGLPDFTYGRLRAGVTSNGLSIWGEVPLNIGDIDNPLLARGVEGAFGAGVSIEAGIFSGTVVWNQTRRQQSEPTSARIDRSALALARILTGTAPLLDGTFTLSAGAGYRHVQGVTAVGDDPSSSVRTGNRFDPVVRLTMGSETGPRGDAARLTAELYGASLIATWSQQLTPLVGYRISASLHGLYGGDDPFVPARSILISPFITLW